MKIKRQYFMDDQGKIRGFVQRDTDPSTCKAYVYEPAHIQGLQVYAGAFDLVAIRKALDLPPEE